jgi:CspA family cold shock protein
MLRVPLDVSGAPRGRPLSLSNGPCACYLVREGRKVHIVSNGIIKKVVADRGFGFITDERGADYFFHRNELERPLDFDRLNGGERVEFQVEQGPKGPRATRVRAA